jgi:hypothetical protein
MHADFQWAEARSGKHKSSPALATREESDGEKKRPDVMTTATVRWRRALYSCLVTGAFCLVSGLCTRGTLGNFGCCDEFKLHVERLHGTAGQE